MGIPEIILIAIGLSMDAAAVSMSNAMVYMGEARGKKIATVVAFGGFQALMPVLGYYAGGLFGEFMDRYSGYIVLAILCGLGIKMIVEGLRKHEQNAPPKLSYGVILTQAVVTSVDAFAVGVGFAAVGANIALASPIIGTVTLIISACSLLMGRKVGGLMGKRAEMLGGIILIVIGVKELFT